MIPSPHNAERIAVVYFENQKGYLIVAPDQKHPTPEGFERKTCNSLREVDALTIRLNNQDRDMFAYMNEKDRAAHALRMEPIKSRLSQRLLEIDCSEIERSFIRSAFVYFARKEKELFHFELRGYFHQREYDSATTDPTDKTGKQVPLPKMSERLASALGRG